MGCWELSLAMIAMIPLNAMASPIPQQCLRQLEQATNLTFTTCGIPLNSQPTEQWGTCAQGIMIKHVDASCWDKIQVDMPLQARAIPKCARQFEEFLQRAVSQCGIAGYDTPNITPAEVACLQIVTKSTMDLDCTISAGGMAPRAAKPISCQQQLDKFSREIVSHCGIKAQNPARTANQALCEKNVGLNVVTLDCVGLIQANWPEFPRLQTRPNKR